MNRGRRLASIAVIAAVGLGGLAGCQLENGKAAFVGDTTITEEQVDQVYDEAVDKAVTATPEPTASPTAAVAPPVSRQQVVDLMVSLELGRRIVIEKKFPAPQEETDPAQIAPELGVSADTAYARLWATWLDVSNVITENTPRTGLTDQGIMEVYGALVETGAIQSGMTVAEVRESFGSAVFAEAAILVSTALGAEAERDDVEINPKYEPVAAPMAVSTDSQVVFYDLPYLSSDMVTDVSL